MKIGYYENLNKYIPNEMIDQLAVLAWPKIKSLLMNDKKLKNVRCHLGDVINYKVWAIFFIS